MLIKNATSYISQSLVIQTDQSQSLVIQTDQSHSLVIQTDQSQSLVIQTDQSQSLVIQTDQSQSLVIQTDIKRVRVRVRNIYFDNEKHDIEETNTETFMCRSMSATIAYIELHMIKN